MKRIKTLMVVLLLTFLTVASPALASDFVLAESKQGVEMLTLLPDSKDDLPFSTCQSLIISRLELCDSEHGVSGNVIINNQSVPFTLTGSFEEYDQGRFGAFSGSTKYEGSMFPLILSLTKANNGDGFAILSVGCCEDDQMELYSFGEYTNAVRLICKERYDKTSAATQSRDVSELGSRSDLTPYHQVSATSVLGGYYVAGISLYFPNSMPNGIPGWVVGKINSYCSSATTYATNHYNIGPETYIFNVFPDEATITLTGSDNNLHTVDGWEPDEDTTSYTATFPAFIYYNHNWNYHTFSLSYTLGGTSVTQSKVHGSSYYDRISWFIYKNSGWATLDGNYSTDSGLAGKCEFKYQGNVPNNITRSISLSGELRYQCVQMIMPNNNYQEMEAYYYYFYTPTANCSHNITITP